MSEVICELCPRACRIPEGGAGDCRVRVNLGGKLRATTYGRPSAVHIDPIEKKPLFHFLPGSRVLSVATAGCNLHCRNCQNWQLSQRGGEQMEQLYHLPPDRLVSEARRTRCEAIAYTYSDPIVFYEYSYDSAEAAREAGLANLFVTAGYINRQPLRRLCRVLDAANTDLKAFDDGFYQRVCGARLGPVLDSLVTLREEGVWVEVTNLLIPTLNDQRRLVRKMARWIRDQLGADTPLHFSRFHPQYRMRNLPPTPRDTLQMARDEAREVGLKYVYIGNLIGDDNGNTYCPRDRTLLVRRIGFRVIENKLTEGGSCPVCGDKIAGVWG